jgi:hypothetical protein
MNINIYMLVLFVSDGKVLVQVDSIDGHDSEFGE